MKGVILAGGYGTRLHPLTSVIGKQLLPVFDKPMIYYPLSTLIHANVDTVLIICNLEDEEKFKLLLGNGEKFGLKIEYKIQSKPEGLAQGIQIAEKFIHGESFWFILGDNLFHGPDFGAELSKITESISGAHIFAYRVQDPSSYGVVTFNNSGNVESLEEKPLNSSSKWAIPGLYYFDKTAISKSFTIKPSKRGELEIIDILKLYLEEDKLETTKISRGNAWFDLGTPETLLSGSNFVSVIQSRQGLMVGSPEEAAINASRLDKEKFITFCKDNSNNHYYKLLLDTLAH